MRGVFITFEGGDGSGKSTQVRRLAAALEAAGADVLVLREPGGTPVGESVREILLGPSHETMTPEAEFLLFAASRAELTLSVIAPALEAGRVVIDDRHADSSLAYQGYGRGLPLETVRAINAFATGGLVPDCTIVLDIEPAVGIAAATGTAADRLEREDIAFHERVRAGFLAIAEAEPERVKVVPRGDVDTVWRDVVTALAPVLSRAGIELESR
ncbi:MAG: dTMP kinase [Actinomycetia bacterium]|nr:dTMP kinase [Actinomycetes bacterium]